jgi:hypothetical protein
MEAAVEVSWFDRALAWLAPQHTLRRARARALLAELETEAERTPTRESAWTKSLAKSRFFHATSAGGYAARPGGD